MIRNMPRSIDAPFWEAMPSSNAFDFQDMYSRAMDRALGVEEASLSAAIDFNSYLFDLYQNSFWFTPAFADLLDTTAKTFAFYTNLQMSWMALMMPQVKLAPEALAHFAEPGSEVMSSNPVASAQASAAEPERDVDIAIGQGKVA